MNTLKWTKGPPGREGWWWWSDGEHMCVVPIKKKRAFGNRLCVFLPKSGWEAVECECGGLWAGPIPEPGTANEVNPAPSETTDLPPSTGRLEQAKRFAMMNFDHWNEVTGVPHPHTSYYYEIASLIEDAVEFGFGVAHGQSWKTIVNSIKQGMRPSTDEEKKSADEFLEKQFGIEDKQ